MSILSEMTVEVNGKKYPLRLTNRALYKSQLELKKAGLMDLFVGLDRMDLETLYCLAKHCVGVPEISEYDLMDSDLDLIAFTTFLASAMSGLFEKKEGDVLEKK